MKWLQDNDLGSLEYDDLIKVCTMRKKPDSGLLFLKYGLENGLIKTNQLSPMVGGILTTYSTEDIEGKRMFEYFSFFHLYLLV